MRLCVSLVGNVRRRHLSEICDVLIFLCVLFLPGLSFPPFNHVGKGEGTATSLSESLPDGKPDAEKDESQLFPHGKCFLVINIECIYAWCISRSRKHPLIK